MRKFVPVIATASLLIGGCAAIAEAHRKAREERLSYYELTCARYGFQMGSTENARCVMQMDQQAIAAERQADAARQAEYERRQSDIQKQMILRPKQTHCTSMPNGFGGFNTTCQ